MTHPWAEHAQPLEEGARGAGQERERGTVELRDRLTDSHGRVATGLVDVPADDETRGEPRLWRRREVR